MTAATGDGADALVSTRTQSTAWPAGDVVQSRAPVAIENVATQPRLLHADPLFDAGYGAYLGVPLAGPEGALHGVLSLYARQPRTWREDEIQAVLASDPRVGLNPT